MDATTERLVDFAFRPEFSALPADTLHACKQHVIDTIASALGAYDEPLSRMARQIARRYVGTPEAGIWGSSLRTSVEAAAFANGVMLRYLDLSDTYLSKSRGHPSDMTSGILAVADHIGADGASVLGAITLAYDVYCSFMDAIDINSKGWDQPVYSVLGCVLGVGRLMKLTRTQMANAVSLALAPNMALTQTRRGDLSSWKGCAGANASRNAVFAAMLAHEGFTGPTAVFEGEGGLWDIVGRFEWPLPAIPAVPHMIGQTHIKRLPVCYHGQSAVEAALALRSRVKLEDVVGIDVAGYRTAVNMMGNDPSRWAPATRETADHSLPYVVAIALLDGEVTAKSFASARLGDPAVAALMKKVTVTEDAGLSAQYPESSGSRIDVRLSSGATLTHEIRYPKGHAKNALTDAEVEAKFRELFAQCGNPAQCETALEALRNLDRAKDVGRDVLARLALRPADA